MPTPGELAPADTALIESVAAGFDAVGAEHRAAAGSAPGSPRRCGSRRRSTSTSPTRRRGRSSSPTGPRRNDPLCRAARGRQPEDAVRAVPSAHLSGGARAARQRRLDRGRALFRTSTEEGGRRTRCSPATTRRRSAAGSPARSSRARSCGSRDRSSASSTRRSPPTSSADGRRRRVIDTHAHLDAPTRPRCSPGRRRRESSGSWRSRRARGRTRGARARGAARGRLRLPRHPPARGRRRRAPDVDGLASCSSTREPWPSARRASTTTAITRPRDAQRAFFERSSRWRSTSASRSSSTHVPPTTTPPRARTATPARSSCTASRRRRCSSRPARRGWYVSFAGNVTYKNAYELRAAARARTGRSAPRRDRQPLSRAPAGARPSQRAGLRRAHLPCARRSAGRRAVGPRRADRCERRGGIRVVSVRPRKALGQHFLVDDNILRVIERLASLSAADVVLEVGPGLGVLTRFLAARVALVHAVEIDRRLEPQLAGIERTELHWGDVLGLDLASLEPPPVKLVANLPYNVATPVVAESLTLESLVGWCVMVQREVADRFFARPSTKAYGAVSVLVQLAAERTGLHPVSREVFRPRPNVDSALVAFRRVAPAAPNDVNASSTPRSRTAARRSQTPSPSAASPPARAAVCARGDRPRRGCPRRGARACRVRPARRGAAVMATRPRRSTSGSWSARCAPDGKHELVTVFQRLDLADRIAVEPADELLVEGFAQDTLVASPRSPRSRRRTRWRATIEKRIPVAAGLGGGSSDAATALRLGNESSPNRSTTGGCTRSHRRSAPTCRSSCARGRNSDAATARARAGGAASGLLRLPPAAARGREGVDRAVYEAFDRTDGAAGFAARAAAFRQALAGVRGRPIWRRCRRTTSRRRRTQPRCGAGRVPSRRERRGARRLRAFRRPGHGVRAAQTLSSRGECLVATLRGSVIANELRDRARVESDRPVAPREPPPDHAGDRRRRGAALPLRRAELVGRGAVRGDHRALLVVRRPHRTAPTSSATSAGSSRPHSCSSSACRSRSAS